MCINYHAFNKETIKDKSSIPVVEELLDELHGSIYFLSLIYIHVICTKDENILKTTFRTHKGYYEFIVMPFGLTNASLTFQAMMDKVFKPYLKKFILVYFMIFWFATSVKKIM